MSAPPDPIVPIAALKSLIADLTGLQVVWITEPRLNLGAMPGRPRAYLILSASSLVGGPQDTIRGTDSDGAPVTNIASIDRLTLSIRCLSLDPTWQAFDVLARLRAQLRGPRAQDARAQSNFALVRMPSLTILPNEQLDSRAVSAAVLDVILSLAVNVPLEDDDGGTIATVNEGAPVGLITGTLVP